MKGDNRQQIFIKIKIIPLALLEGRWYTGRKIRQIGQNGLCMLAAISKRANGMIFIFMKIGCLMSLFNEFIDNSLCSFQFHQNILKYTVSRNKGPAAEYSKKSCNVTVFTVSQKYKKVRTKKLVKSNKSFS